LAVVGLLWSVAGQASAGVLFTDSGNGDFRNGYTGSQVFTGTVGASFLNNTTNIVTALGFFDGPNSAAGSFGDGLLTTHQVGLWNAGGTLLGSVIVAAGTVDPLIGDFRYHSLTTQITLAAGQRYTLGAFVSSAQPDNTPDPTNDIFRDDGHSGNPAVVGTDIGASNFSAVYNPVTFADPPNTHIGPAYLGPNLATIPEPATLTLFGAGMLGLAAYGWRRRTRAIAG
jgi:hypothetical protein